MNRKKLLRKLARGSLHNVAFADMVHLVEGFGFALDRVSGGHHIFVHPRLPELINLQEVSGQAKPYQIRQFLRLIERYNLKLEG
jgi:predicted RNA binding protein YcfA (HicA-like mRNA interferase family)